MTGIEDRIAQFENMAAADASNDMAHFSLGNAYLQAERHDEAAASFQRCVDLNPDMSKAYELGGKALKESGKKDEAIAWLEIGYKAAAVRGDLMPRDAMATMLTELGHPVPELSDEQKKAAPAGGSFVCRCTGQAGTKMDDPPMRGPVGAWIADNISVETWQRWIGQGTKVINELRLDFSSEQDQNVYEQHMYEFLGIDEAVLSELTDSSTAG